MKSPITKKECIDIVLRLTQWLDFNSPFHYLYISVNNEMKNYRQQLALMEELELDIIENKIPTNYYKIIQWSENTPNKILC